MRYFAFLTKASLRYFEVPLNNYLIYRYSCLNLAALGLNRLHHSLSRCLTLHVYIAVVGIPGRTLRNKG